MYTQTRFKQALMLAASILTSSLVHAWPLTNGNGLQSTRTVSLENSINSIDISGNFEVNVESGLDNTVSFTIDENLIDQVSIKSDLGELKISMGHWISPSKRPTLRLKVKNLSSLAKIELSGAVNLPMGKIQKLSLSSVELSGRSQLELDLSQTTDFHVNLSGSSTIKIGGNVKDLILVASGANSANLLNLEGHSLQMELSGSNTVEYGNFASVKKETSGANSISKH